MWREYRAAMDGVPLALVLQDGIENEEIPWSDLAAVFVGGSDRFKYSREARGVAREAKRRGLLVHVGRVNTAERMRGWKDLADSIDGSGISRYDHMLAAVLSEIRGESPQMCLFSSVA